MPLKTNGLSDSGSIVSGFWCPHSDSTLRIRALMVGRKNLTENEWHGESPVAQVRILERSRPRLRFRLEGAIARTESLQHHRQNAIANMV